jgi:Ca-activated chloride channel family protein
MKRNVEGVDIMIVLDISDSMVIEDMPPFKNRMDAAKETIKDFIKARTSDRIGFIVFSGESFTRVPLTLDYDLLLNVVSETDSSRNIKMGTAIGVAMANGAARLKDSTAKSRVMIFLTDGENNSGTIDPDTGLDIAKGYGIKMYTVGIGRDGETRIPVITTDPFGNKVKRYQPFFSTVNEDLLQRAATETGGKYYRATSGNKLKTFFEEIDKLEKTKVDVNKYTKYAELYPPYLEIGILLYFLSLVLSQTVLRRNP